jgi:hypothetical protein
MGAAGTVGRPALQHLWRGRPGRRTDPAVSDRAVIGLTISRAGCSWRLWPAPASTSSSALSPLAQLLMAGPKTAISCRGGAGSSRGNSAYYTHQRLPNQPLDPDPASLLTHEDGSTSRLDLREQAESGVWRLCQEHEPCTDRPVRGRTPAAIEATELATISRGTPSSCM